jgi:hypothetical protein
VHRDSGAGRERVDHVATLGEQARHECAAVTLQNLSRRLSNDVVEVIDPSTHARSYPTREILRIESRAGHTFSARVAETQREKNEIDGTPGGELDLVVQRGVLDPDWSGGLEDDPSNRVDTEGLFDECSRVTAHVGPGRTESVGVEISEGVPGAVLGKPIAEGVVVTEHHPGVGGDALGVQGARRLTKGFGVLEPLRGPRSKKVTLPGFVSQWQVEGRFGNLEDTPMGVKGSREAGRVVVRGERDGVGTPTDESLEDGVVTDEVPGKGVAGDLHQRGDIGS